jgi:hypothetical protein
LVFRSTACGAGQSDQFGGGQRGIGGSTYSDQQQARRNRPDLIGPSTPQPAGSLSIDRIRQDSIHQREVVRGLGLGHAIFTSLPVFGSNIAIGNPLEYGLVARSGCVRNWTLR